MPVPRAVIEAKTLLDEARDWWAWSWASEENKIRVRSAIETATEALAREVEKAKSAWSPDMKNAYRDCTSQEARGKHANQVDPRIRRAARELKDIEDEWKQATAQSKQSFAEAERELDAAKARQGALQAKDAIQKHEIVLELARRATPAAAPGRRTERV